MQKLKKLLAIFFAVILAVTFMPNIPQGTVKAAEAGENTSYDKAISVNTGETVNFTSKKDGDNYPSLCYTLNVKESGTYAVSMASEDSENSLSLSASKNSGSGSFYASTGTEKIVQLQAGDTYTIWVYSGNWSENKPDSISGSFSIVKNDMQFTQQIDGEAYDGASSVLVDYGTTKTLSVVPDTTSGESYTYAWKKSGSEDVLSTEATYQYPVVDSSAVFCTITSGEKSVDATFNMDCQTIKINSVTVNGEKQEPNEYGSANFSGLDGSKLEVVIDAVNLKDVDAKMEYSWTGYKYGLGTSTNDTLDSKTNTYSGTVLYNSVYCSISDGTDQRSVSISLSYSQTIEYEPNISINGKASDYSSTNATVAKGDDVVLKVNATTKSSGTLAYQWYEVTQNTNGYTTYNKIDSATNSEYSPKIDNYGRLYYACEVSDGKSNPIQVNFELNNPSIQTSQNVMINGEDNDEGSSYIQAKVGDQIDLVVNASEIGTSTKDLTYTWYKSENYGGYGNSCVFY